MTRVLSLVFIFFLIAGTVSSQKKATGITYDARSLIVNGNRELIFSGSIHYPRIPQEAWPDIIAKAKAGGLNVIDTYIFWNIHEPSQGQFNFEGNNDVVKFLKLIKKNDMWVILRLGPYIEAEWNLGGFPYWLKEVPQITFRTYNQPFMMHMKQWVEKVINMMKDENLFIDQGGPIIMAQIENEYTNVQAAYRDEGAKYVKWAADMATYLYPTIPWIMCKQHDAPDNIIKTCNGRQCGDTFSGGGNNKPTLWTENWTAQYRVFGDPPSQRAAEDIAFAVARFFARNGTMTNYYMYHGGTNYGRTGSSFVPPRYYDEAPLDEYGLKREPKWGHLKDLHRALKLVKKPLLWGTSKIQKINQDLEAITWEKAGTDICAAFLTNNHTKAPATINFRGMDYYLPPKSISILPDCKTVVYNTMRVVSQHNARTYVPAVTAKDLKWEKFHEVVPTMKELQDSISKGPKELHALTQDTTDYAWYITSIAFDKNDLPMRPDILPVLQIASLGHAMLLFVNGEYQGFAHGNNIEKSFVLQKPVKLKVGMNDIAILAMTVGIPNSGAYMEKRFAGPRGITIQGLMAGTLDITMNNWAHGVGLTGEKLEVHTEKGTTKVKWRATNATKTPMTWFKAYFDSPAGDDPLAINMTTMGKGMVWVNGNSLGRYWVTFLTPLQKPTQAEYHIPRAFLKPQRNLIIIFEEEGGSPEEIEIYTVNRDTICSVISEYHPPHVKSWERKDGQLHEQVDPIKTGAHLSCPENKVITKVDFADFGDPDGACGIFSPGTCHSNKAFQVVNQQCLGKNQCVVHVERETLNDPKDGCPDIAKTLAIQARCGFPENRSS